MTISSDSWETVRAATAALKAIGNEHRLLMLCALADAPRAVGELSRQLPLAQSAVSQHLARLRSTGLVVTHREGPKVRYALADGRTRRVLDTVRAAYDIPAWGSHVGLLVLPT